MKRTITFFVRGSTNLVPVLTATISTARGFGRAFHKATVIARCRPSEISPRDESGTEVWASDF